MRYFITILHNWSRKIFIFSCAVLKVLINSHYATSRKLVDRVYEHNLKSTSNVKFKESDFNRYYPQDVEHIIEFVNTSDYYYTSSEYIEFITSISRAHCFDECITLLLFLIDVEKKKSDEFLIRLDNIYNKLGSRLLPKIWQEQDYEKRVLAFNKSRSRYLFKFCITIRCFPLLTFWVARWCCVLILSSAVFIIRYIWAYWKSHNSGCLKTKSRSKFFINYLLWLLICAVGGYLLFWVVFGIGCVFLFIAELFT